LPSKVLSTVMSNEELREPTFETFYQHFPNATFRYSCGGDGWPLTPPYTTGIRNFEEKRAIALDIYPEVKQRLPKVPGIALDLMKNIASPKEFKLALEQVENARHAELLVIIQNTGWGTARNVRLLPPRGFRLENPVDYERHVIIPGQTEISEADLVYPEDPMIDLGARKSALYAFITAPGDSAIQLNDRSSLLPAAETGAVINLPVVVGVTVILFVGLWLPAIIKDIRQYNPPDRSNP
jgi:hypothetical protein